MSSWVCSSGTFHRLITKVRPSHGEGAAQAEDALADLDLAQPGIASGEHDQLGVEQIHTDDIFGGKHAVLGLGRRRAAVGQVLKPASSSPDRSKGFSKRAPARRSTPEKTDTLRQSLAGSICWSSMKKPCVARWRMRGERIALSG